MATYTSNYNLRKDSGSDRYSVSTQNGNMDIIDTVLADHDTRLDMSLSHFTFKGTCTYNNLPANPTQNDTWYVSDRNRNYTWNGTIWAQSSAEIIIDDSLQTQGEAADAKVTGDAITSINTDLNSFKTKTTTEQQNQNRRLFLLEEAAIGKLYTEEIVTGTSYQQIVPSGSLSSAIVGEWSGSTFVWNQLNNNRYSTATKAGVTYTNNNDGSWTMTGSGTATNRKPISDVSLIIGHVYVVLNGGIDTTGTGINICLSRSGTNLVSFYNEQVLTASVSYDQFSIRTFSNFVAPEGGLRYEPRLVDLTLMYGAGNEPTSMNDPRMPGIRAYAQAHPERNTGAIMSADVVSIDTSGRNLYNGVWESTSSYGYVYKFHAKAGQTVCVYANPTRSTPNDYTYINGYVNNSLVSLADISDAANYYWYTTSWASNPKIFTMTVDSDLVIYWALSGGYGADAASHFNELQIEFASARTEYVPYRAPITHSIPASVLTAYPLRSAGTVYDTISWDGSKWWHTKRVLSKNLGEYSWLALETPPNMYAISNHGLPTKQIAEGATANMTCKYVSTTTASGGADTIDKSIALGTVSSKAIYIHDSSGGSASAFNAAIQGVYCNFELATPVVTDITDLMGDWKGVLEVEAGGTVTLAQSDGKIFSVPNTVNYLVKTTGGA